MGLLDTLQRGAQGINGLLFPGLNATGVDPNTVRMAQAQAMLQLGSGLLGGGQNYGAMYGAAQSAGYEPIEQARRQAVMDAEAQWRTMQTKEWERKRQQEEAKAMRDAQIEAAMRGVPLDPSNPQGYAAGIASAVAPVDPSLALEALKVQQGFAPKDKNPLTLSRGQIAIDPATGQEIARGLPPEPTQGPVGSWSAPFDAVDPTTGKPGLFQSHSLTGQIRPAMGLSPAPKVDREKQKVEIQLSNNFQQQSQTHATVAGQYRRMIDLANNPSPANDMALIYSFAKINDPNSVVRESEFAAAAKVGTYGQAVQVAANKIANGEMLTPAQRADFINAAGNQYKSSEAQWYQGVVAPAQQQAKAYGLNWGNIYKDYRVRPETGKTAPTGKAPMVGQVVKGYKFKGGDPSKQENWVRQ